MTLPRTADQPLDESGVANAEKGLVILDGPDGVAITLTPAAAMGTAQSLMNAAVLAAEQARAAGLTAGTRD